MAMSLAPEGTTSGSVGPGAFGLQLGRSSSVMLPPAPLVAAPAELVSGLPPPPAGYCYAMPASALPIYHAALAQYLAQCAEASGVERRFMTVLPAVAPPQTGRSDEAALPTTTGGGAGFARAAGTLP